MRRTILQRFSGDLLAALVAAGTPGAVQAATCTADDFATAVDKSGSQLRTFNAEALPKLRDKLRELRDAKGWDGADYEEKGLDSVRDARAEKFDADAEELITKIDMLGRPPTDKQPDCAKLSELQAAELELLALMKAKSAYTISKIDAEIAGKAPASPAAEPPKSREPQVANEPPPGRRRQACVEVRQVEHQDQGGDRAPDGSLARAAATVTVVLAGAAAARSGRTRLHHR